jgi:hypothetical protein
MPIKEQITAIETTLAMNTAVTGDGTYDTGHIIDCSKYNNGVGIAMMALGSESAIGAGSVFTMELYHGDEDDLSDAVSIPIKMLVYGRDNSGILPFVIGEMDLGMKLSQEGVFATKRYIKPKLEVSAWDGTGTANVIMIAIKNAEVVPVTQRLGSVS